MRQIPINTTIVDICFSPFHEDLDFKNNLGQKNIARKDKDIPNNHIHIVWMKYQTNFSEHDFKYDSLQYELIQHCL